MGEEIATEKTGGRIFPSPKAAPWLVIPYGKSGTPPRKQAFYNICEPNNRTCRKSIPELIAKRYWQKPSHQGWLIILCDDKNYDYSPDCLKYGDCFLWNPTTLKRIHLPSLLKWYCDESTCSNFVDCVLTSSPAGDDSMVLFVFTDAYKGSCNIFFLYCHPGTYKWFSDIIRAKDMLCIDYFKGRFYVMCLHEENLEIEKQKAADGRMRLCVRMIEVTDKCSYPFVGGLDTFTPLYNFLATDDELYCIQIIFTTRGFWKVIIQIVAMRLDFSAMAWKVVHSIGDHVLCIGGSCNTKACCSAAETGLPRGCLYFTLPGDQRLYKYSIESTSNSVIMPFLKLPKPQKVLVSDFIMMPYNGRKRKRKREKKEHKKNLIKAVGYKEADVVISNREDGKQGGNDDDSFGDFEKACPWGILNGDMVESVAKCLHRLDYIHLRSVSKAYRALMPMVKRTSTTTGTYLSPWLMFSRDHGDTTFTFINPMHNNENYLLKLSDLVRTVVRFQKGGWLLVSMENNEFGLFFYNPLTRETIKLPELPFTFTFSSISFSSSPTSPDCVVFAIEQKGAYEVSLYFIRKGEAGWSSCLFCNTDTEIYTPSHNTPVFYDGVLYCVDYNGRLGVFDMKYYSWKLLKKPNQTFSAIHPSFLVECGGELLLVKLGRLGSLFGIFRWDFSGMDWVRIKNLGFHMLFISHTSCFSEIAPNSRMENKVYVPRLCMNGEGVLVYCLDTASYRSFGSQHSASNFDDTEGWYLNCTWLEPNWSMSTGQELHWVKPSS